MKYNKINNFTKAT